METISHKVIFKAQLHLLLNFMCVISDHVNAYDVLKSDLKKKQFRSLLQTNIFISDVMGNLKSCFF